jgi:RNA polymerase sigma factor (TIGR02999 family)
MEGEGVQFTRLLEDARCGDTRAAEVLFPLVYQALRDLARQQMAHEREGHTLEPTALVHEAYLKLLDGTPVSYDGRAHFLRAAAEAMRRILIDHGKSKGRAKRGGKLKPQQLSECDVAVKAKSDEILTIEEAISRLEEQDATAAAVVRMRFYAGLSVEDVAAALGVSVATIGREWAFARAYLYRELAEDWPEWGV